MKLKKLRIFDFDDTIFETEAKVVVISADGTSREITPAEYAVYEPLSGDKFDFSQFNTIINPTLIRSIGKRFYKIVTSSNGSRKTVILTARGSEAAPHIRDIIRNYFRVNIEVVTLGTGDPMAKANWIKNKIENEGYNDIFFVDDSSKNILATYRTIGNLPIKYKLVDITTPRKYEGNNLTKTATNLAEMLKNIVDKEKLKKAYKFFSNKLSLPTGKIKLEFGSLEGDVQGKVKVEGDAKPFKVKKYTLIMRTNNPHSGDDQIKTLAHECWHIKQVEDGKLNTFDNSWEGKVYPRYEEGDSREKSLPWEVDARINAEDLFVEYNRYAREKGAASKIIKIS
jgi:hypothetical protein